MRLLLSLLVLLRTAASRAACPAALALPPSGLPDVASPPEKAGWCAPYASAASTLDGVRTPAGVCRGITVPAGAVLEFGTCALPGAACTGATALSLLYAAALPTDPPLLSLEQVTLNSAVAYLSAGCTLGVRCSSGEWRNNNLTTAAVVIYEACAGRDSCVGVVAWRTTFTPELLPLLLPSATRALAFDVRASSAASLNAVSGAGAPALPGAHISVLVYGRLVSAFGGSTLRWTLLANTSAWDGSASIPFAAALALPSGGVASLMVSATTPGAALTCAHALGEAGDALLSDSVLTVEQGGQLAAGAFPTAAPGTACAWEGLLLSYSVPTACVLEAPPAPAIRTSEPRSLVVSLDYLQRALADPNVSYIEVDAHVALNGSALSAALGVDGTRSLQVEGTFACRSARTGNPLCSLDAGGASRVFEVVHEGVQLRLAQLALLNGAAPAGGSGGCLLLNCSNCSLAIDTVTASNCSAAPPGGGGAIAVLGGGALQADGLTVLGCRAGVGGGLLVVQGSMRMNASFFKDNAASQDSQEPLLFNLNDVPGPSGGAVALISVTGTIDGSSFTTNAVTTTDVVIVDNAGVPQANGGALFIVAGSFVNISASTLSGNAASFGGGVYVDASEVVLTAVALMDNLATLGEGGALFSTDAPVIDLMLAVILRNAAGGRGGGGVACYNSTLTLQQSLLSENDAPAGCGGAVMLDVGASLLLSSGTTVADNVAGSGGGLCGMQLTSFTVADSWLRNNSATAGSGGALYVSYTPARICNTSLLANSAPAGGAVAAISSMLNLTDCLLDGNAATSTHGGAVFHDASNDLEPSHARKVEVEAIPSLFMLRCGLAGNAANAAGGAVAAFWSAELDISACVFANNFIAALAPTGGALMALNVGLLVVTGCTFEANSIEFDTTLSSGLLGYTSSVSAPGAGCGGAVWVGSDSLTTSLIEGSSWTSNVAPNGAGLYVSGAASLTIRGCAFESNSAVGSSTDGTGGALMTDEASTLAVVDTRFAGCAAVRGAAGWHGAASVTTYRNCTFTGNYGMIGDDTKGSALFLDEGASSASLSVTGSSFLGNIGEGTCEGTIAMGRSNATHLVLADSLFDGNTVRLGAGFLIAAISQVAQLSVSGLTFRNNRALIGGVMYVESSIYGPLICSPVACDWSLNNSASDYGDIIGTPPKVVNITMPAHVRSGAPLPAIITLVDGFGSLLQEWPNCVVEITTDALLTGSLRSFYTGGAAVYNSLVLRGMEGVSYNLTFTISAPDLFGNDVTTRVIVVPVAVQLCEPAETFNVAALDCACAVGYGLVVADHSCRTCTHEEVVPPDGLSCVACPALSNPDPKDTSQCVCQPGYAGAIFGATGACAQCPADFFRSATDPPEFCLPCPATSHTFALGARSQAACLCAQDYFGAIASGNASEGSFSCAPVPNGGWAPQADSRLYALAGWWRPSAAFTTFWPCSSGLCLRELPQNVTPQLGYNCRAGHVGHLCAVCEIGWAYQGNYCVKCKPGTTYPEWSLAKQRGIVVSCVLVTLAVAYLIIFLPLCPETEAWLERTLTPISAWFESVLGSLTSARAGPPPPRRPDSAGRPRSAIVRPAAEAPLSGTEPEEGGSPVTPMTPASPMPEIVMTELDGQPRISNVSITSDSLSVRASSVRSLRINTSSAFHSVGLPPDASPKVVEEPPAFAVKERQTRTGVIMGALGEPVRIVISFWQLVSSFNSSLAVPWPALYTHLASSLNVVSLQFLKLPAISCLQPQQSFLTTFTGVTVATLLFCILCLVSYHYGRRTAVALADAERRRRFQSRCINVFIWGLFLIYPQISQTTLSIFSCTSLENGTAWLTSDYRVQCWTAKHKLYMGVAALFTLLFPIGIPVGMLAALYYSRVPELAAWKRDSAWLRAITQRAIVLNLLGDERTDELGAAFDSDTLTTESISLPLLRQLNQLFVSEGQDDVEVPEKAAKADGAAPLESLTVRQQLSTLASEEGEAEEAEGAPLPRWSMRRSDAVRPPRSSTVSLSEQALGDHLPRWSMLRSNAVRLPRFSAISQWGGSDRSHPTFARPSAPALSGDALASPELRRHSSRAFRRPDTLPGEGRLAGALRAAQQWVAHALGEQGAAARSTLFNMLYANEREMLIGSLLHWAKHDRACVVPEPQPGQTRWRTEEEWTALRAAGLHLGARDTVERAAFYRLNLIFGGYATHAWYWNLVDNLEKLFLCSVILFIAPRSPVQVIVASMFAFVTLVVTIEAKPYSESANNQLLALVRLVVTSLQR